MFEEDINSYVGILRHTNKLSRNSKMFKDLKRYFQKQAEGLTTENDTDILNISGEQYRVMWTLEEDVLNKGEISAFYDKISELQKQNYKLSQDGECIFAINNKLVYADSDFYYPEITKVISFESENEINDLREVIFDGEEQSSLETSLSIIEAIKGEGFITVSNFENSRAYERQNGGRKGKNSRTSDTRSGEDVELYSKSSPTDPSDLDVPPLDVVSSEQMRKIIAQLKADASKKIDANIC